MDLQQLKTFRAVVATGSVRGAADSLGYSPSAVSQQVSALQRSCAVTLLARVGRGLEPTAAGLALADRIDDLLGELGEIQSLLQDLREGRQGRLTLAYIASLGASWLPQVAGPLMSEYPGLALELRVTDEFDPSRQPRFDLQLAILDRHSPEPAGLRVEHLADDPYLVALPPGHRLLEQDRVALPDLAADRWIDNDLTGGLCRRIVLDACASVGFQPRFHVETQDYTTALALVSAGLGVSVVPRLGTLQAPPGLALRPLIDPTPVRSVHVVVNTSIGDSAPMTRAVDLLRETARRTAARITGNVAGSRPELVAAQSVASTGQV